MFSAKARTVIYPLSLHDALPISQTPGPFWLYYFNVAAVEAAMTRVKSGGGQVLNGPHQVPGGSWIAQCFDRSEEHTSELQSLTNLVCRLLLEKKKTQ